MRLTRYSQSIEALGGTASIGMIGAWSEHTANQLFNELWQYVYRFEKRFSRFLPSSELSLINRRAGLTTEISTEMQALLAASESFSIATKGLYNPFILPALQRSGYLTSVVEKYHNDPPLDYRGRQVVDADELKIKDNTITIPHNTALDLGGIGKGYLADILANIIKSYDAAGFWVDLSGDIALYGHDENSQALHVAIQDSSAIIVGDGRAHGVATSGTMRRHKIGTHHIIDPRTGESAETDLRLATIIAKDATTADILASCALLVGRQAAPSWLKSHGAMAWYLQAVDGTIVEESSKYIQNREVAYAS